MLSINPLIQVGPYLLLVVLHIVQMGALNHDVHVNGELLEQAFAVKYRIENPVTQLEFIAVAVPYRELYLAVTFYT
jgi:hypothetical protein